METRTEYCMVCRKNYKPGMVSCCVVHPPGQCCHLGDEMLVVDDSLRLPTVPDHDIRSEGYE